MYCLAKLASLWYFPINLCGCGVFLRLPFFNLDQKSMDELEKKPQIPRGRTRPPTAPQKSRTKVAQYHPTLELPTSRNYLWKSPSFPLPRAPGNEAEGGFAIISSAPRLRCVTWGGRGSPQPSPQTQRVARSWISIPPKRPEVTD